MLTMPTLSLCTVVLDDKTPIDISPFSGYVDEIILVHPTNIIPPKETPAKTFAIPWNSDFSEMWNAAISKAKGDWILAVHPNERIASEDLIKIKNLIAQKGFQGISLVQRNYTHDGGMYPATGPFGKGYQGYTPTRTCRVFQNKQTIRFRYKIYSRVDESIMENKGVIIKTDISIHNYQSPLAKKERKEYIALCLAQIQETPQDPKPYYELGILYQEEKNDLALSMFEKAAALDEKYLTPYTCIGDLYAEQKQWEKAKKAYQKSIALQNDVSAWVNLGVMHERTGNEKEAANCFRQALVREPSLIPAYRNFYALFLKTRRYVAAWHLLKLAAEKTGLEEFTQKRDAFREKLFPVIEKELKKKPGDAQLLTARAELLRG